MKQHVHHNPADPSVALIVGATGLVRLSLAEALNDPSIPGRPWKVYGAARRPLPTWFPPSLLHHFISFDAFNSDDTNEELSPITDEVTHVCWVALQVVENEERNITINATMLRNVLNALINSTTQTSPLRHVTLQMGTKHYLGPVFDPSLAGKLTHQEPSFQENYPKLPYPNFYNALEDLVALYLPALTYSIHHPSIIIGTSAGSFHNTLLTLAVYANICEHERLLFRYLGSKYTWEHFCDMSDARVLAEQQKWEAIHDNAKNQTLQGRAYGKFCVK